MEQRFIKTHATNLRMSGSGRTLAGYAARFGTPSTDPNLGFNEILERGCFRDALRTSDTVCLLNHDASLILGRKSAGTLRVAEDNDGLTFECDLPDSPMGDNVRASVARGDLNAMSFGFVVDGDGQEWDEDYDEDRNFRVIRRISRVASLQDVSVCTHPAYGNGATSVGLRSLFPGGVPVEIRSRFPELGNKSSRNRKEERYARSFRTYLAGRLNEAEQRATENEYWGRPTTQSYKGGDLSGGTTSGIAGGFMVPAEFYKETLNAMAQVTPLLDPSLVSLDAENSYILRGKVYPGWDFSKIAAIRVGEVTQTSPNDINPAPASYAKMLASYIYKSPLAIALELLQDSQADGGIVESLIQAYAVAFARGIGADLINGNGTGEPQGLLAGATSSGVTGAITLDNLRAVYFSVNRIYRASKKCAWVMTDGQYKQVRALKDGNQRPLIDTVDDKEKLFGSPVVISPDLPDYVGSPVVNGKLLFGDLSHYRVHVSAMSVTRSMQSGLPNGVGDIERGEVLLTGRMRADAVVHDASGGVTPPIVYATINA